MDNCVRNKYFFIFVNIFLVTIITLRFFSSRLKNTINKYGEYECENIINKLISEELYDDVLKLIDGKVINMSEDKKITVDSYFLNSLCAVVNKKMQEIMYKINNDKYDYEYLKNYGINSSKKEFKYGIFYKIPYSVAFKNSLISKLGPSIPIKYKMVGKTSSQIVSNISEHGINNIFVDISLEISTKSIITVPLLSKENETKFKLPLVMQILQGEVPNYLLGENILGGF